MSRDPLSSVVRTPSTADEWVQQRRGRHQTAEEEAAFKAWLEADPANAAEYDVAKDLAAFPRFLRDFPPDIAAHAFLEALDSRAHPRASPDTANAKTARDRGTIWFAGVAIVLALAVIWHHLA